MGRQQLAIAGAMLGLLFLILGALVFFAIPDKNSSAFNIFLGAVLGYASSVMSFAFPGNINTATKDNTISNLAAATATPVVTKTTEVVTSGTTEAVQ